MEDFDGIVKNNDYAQYLMKIIKDGGASQYLIDTLNNLTCGKINTYDLLTVIGALYIDLKKQINK